MTGANPFAVIRWAQRQTQIGNPVRSNVLVAIAINADAKGICWPSQERLAEETRYSERAVRMALDWLEAEGYLRRERRQRANGSRMSDRIILMLDRPAHHRQDVPVGQADPTGIPGQAYRNPMPNLPARDSTPTTFEEPGEEPKEESPEPDGSGTGLPAPRARSRLFSEGRPALIALGLSRREAGALIGRWLRDTGDDTGRVLDAIRRARDQAPHEPIAWITARLQPGKDNARNNGHPTLNQALDGLSARLRTLGEL